MPCIGPTSLAFFFFFKASNSRLKSPLVSFGPLSVQVGSISDCIRFPRTLWVFNRSQDSLHQTRGSPTDLSKNISSLFFWLLLRRLRVSMITSLISLKSPFFFYNNNLFFCFCEEYWKTYHLSFK